MKNVIYHYPWPSTLKICVYAAYCCLLFVLSPSLFLDYIHSSKQNIVFSENFFYWSRIPCFWAPLLPVSDAVSLPKHNTLVCEVRTAHHKPNTLYLSLWGFVDWRPLWYHESSQRGGISCSAMMEGSLGSVWTLCSSWLDQTTVDNSDLSLWGNCHLAVNPLCSDPLCLLVFI